MAKVRLETEKVVSRFNEGTCARMKDMLRDGETLPQFIRQAVERELKFRMEHPAQRLGNNGLLSVFFRTGTFGDSDLVI